MSAAACRPTGSDPGAQVWLSSHGYASVMLGECIVGCAYCGKCAVASVGGIVMVDGNDEWLSGTYGTDGADTCTHDDVACDDCVGSDLIAISICGGATYGAAVNAMRTLG